MKAAVVGFVAPAIFLAAVVLAGRQEQSTQQETSSTSAPATTHSTSVSTPPETTQQQPSTGKPDYTISVLLDDETVEMELEEYVVGVVLAEIPASFASEALKAQAVAARTAALYICTTARHHGCVCASFSCCQAYMSAESYLSAGGAEESVAKVREAVYATAGQVMLYDNEVICAAYFSCSGGYTEDAVEVWGSDVPYLQSVESPGEEFASVFTDCVYFTPEEFQEALCVRLEGEPESWFGTVTYTEGGGVASMEIGGVCYRGTTLRTLLRLRSTVFTVTVSGGQICITTRGYGHRVGMSQYGAQAMALGGAAYESILTYYYQGARLEQYAGSAG